MASAPLSPESSTNCSVTDHKEFRGRQHSKQLWPLCLLVVLLLQIVVVAATTSVSMRSSVSSSRIPSFASPKKVLAFDIARSFPRGGSALFGGEYADEEEAEDDDEDDEEEENNESDIRQHPDFEKLQAYQMKQQVLLQLRATYLSEALGKRGLPIATLKEVATPGGKTPPKMVDWDCAMTTKKDTKNCLISYEPEPGSKLLVPTELVSSDKWITLKELNKLRRNDPSKVEPMWNDQYDILRTWFGPNSRYSLLQHVGPKGVILSTILDGNRLPTVVFFGLVILIVQLMPIIEVIVNRLLVSSLLWTKWLSWYRYMHMGLPFKLLICQIAYSYLRKAFKALTSIIKVKLVEMECEILEQTIPLTVGEGSEVVEEVEDVSFPVDVDENDDEEVSSASEDDEEESDDE